MSQDAGDFIGDLNDFRQVTAAIYEDALKAAGVSAGDLATLKKYAKLHGGYASAGELAYAAASDDQEALAKAAAGLAVGVLAGAAKKWGRSQFSIAF